MPWKSKILSHYLYPQSTIGKLMNALTDVGFILLVIATSVFSIWGVQLHAHTPAHTPAHAPLVWCVHTPLLFIDIYRLGHWNEENERGTKAWHLVVDQFSLTFDTFSWAWMLYFQAWLQNNRKLIVRGEYDN